MRSIPGLSNLIFGALWFIGSVVVVALTGRLFYVALLLGAIQGVIGLFQLLAYLVSGKSGREEHHMKVSLKALYTSMIAVAMADGEFEQGEESAIQQVIKQLTNDDIDSETLRESAEEVGKDLNGTLKRLNDYGRQVDSDFKPIIIKACLIVSTADGSLDPREEAVMLKITNALGLPDSVLRDELNELLQTIAESA